MKYKLPPGVFDIIPNDPKEKWRSSYLWQYVEKTIREVTRLYGYHEIRTPLFEKTDLFTRSVGESSDIVSKEMYTFIDKGERSLTLRPEGTAPIMRAVVENGLTNQSTVQKLFTIGPMFRYERSQAGRYRQHHQLSVESVGYSSPEQDAELIDMIHTLYKRLGIKKMMIQLNSIGTPKNREKYRTALQQYLQKNIDSLSEDSQKRFHTNPLRILDSKSPNDQQLLEGAPSILDHLDEESNKHFTKVQELLKQLEIPFTINEKLVRGLDYYNHTVFEITAEELGAHNTIGAGGRYDGLIKALGGADLPAVGFATGLERVIQTLLNQQAELPPPTTSSLFLVPLGDAARQYCFTLLHQLRQQNISCEMDFSGRKLGKVMHYADQIDTKYTAVFGDDELTSKQIKLKNMETGESTTVSIEDLARTLNA